MNKIDNNRRIMKNAGMLYFRMFLSMLVSLYTVRVVLNTLGTIDYGIYGTVAGVVIMFSFITSSMSSASQRFFAFEIGTGNFNRLKDVFSTTVIIYIFFILIIVILAETLGLWFLKNYLVIPEDRSSAALFIYQFSILSFIVTVLSIPYNANIVAHENMTVYAYVGINDVILKLLVVFLLNYLNYDKLELYGILIFLVSCISFGIYFIYNLKKYRESRIHICLNPKIFIEILSYSGWNLFGAFSSVANEQGTNIVLNIFFGPVINAAMLIANQIKNSIIVFYTNFYMAVNPQIIKSYACGEREYMNKLIYSSTKLAFSLLLVLAIPLFFEMDYILKLWLKSYTADMVLFARLIILYVLVISLENPLTQAVRATGNIKKYQILVGITTILVVPISFLFLKLGFAAFTVIWVSIIVYFIATFVRLYVLKILLLFDIKKYLLDVMLRLLILILFSLILPTIIYFNLSEGLIRFCILFFVNILSLLFFSYYILLSNSEKKQIKQIFTRLKK